MRRHLSNGRARMDASSTAWAAHSCGFTPYAQHVFVFGLALAALALFLAGLIRDVRSFSNAVFLGLALALGALGAAEYLVGLPGHRARLVVLALVLLGVVGPAIAASYLLVNGVTMVRREGLRLANLLPLVAGFAIIAVIALVIAAERVGSAKLSLFSAVAVLLFGYVSFLFVSFALYGFLYNRLALFRRADFVIVLGSGLIDGERVPPLLASRLERGRAVYQRLARRSKDHAPVVDVSGGQGRRRTGVGGPGDGRVPGRARVPGQPAGTRGPLDQHRREHRVQPGDHGANPSRCPVCDRDQRLSRVAGRRHRPPGGRPRSGRQRQDRWVLPDERATARVRSDVPALPGDQLRRRRADRRRPGGLRRGPAGYLVSPRPGPAAAASCRRARRGAASRAAGSS